MCVVGVNSPANINELPCLVARVFDDDMKAMFEEHYKGGHGDHNMEWRDVLQDVRPSH